MGRHPNALQDERRAASGAAPPPLEACHSEPVLHPLGPALRPERSLRDISERAAMGIEALRDPITRRLQKYRSAEPPAVRAQARQSLHTVEQPSILRQAKKTDVPQGQTPPQKATCADQHVQSRITTAPLLAAMWHHRVEQMDLSSRSSRWGHEARDSTNWQCLCEDSLSSPPDHLHREFTEADMSINYNPLEVEASLVSESSLSEVSKDVYWRALRPGLCVAPPSELQERAAAVVRVVEERLRRGERLRPAPTKEEDKPIKSVYVRRTPLTSGQQPGKFKLSRGDLLDHLQKDEEAARAQLTPRKDCKSPMKVGISRLREPRPLAQDASERSQRRQAVLDLWARSPRRSSQLLAPWSPRNAIHKASPEVPNPSGQDKTVAKAGRLLRAKSSPVSAQGTLPELEDELQAGEDAQYSGSYGSMSRRAASRRKMYEVVSSFNSDAYEEGAAAEYEGCIQSNTRHTASAIRQASLNPGNLQARRQWARALDDLRSHRPHFKALSPRDLKERQTRADPSKATPDVLRAEHHPEDSAWHAGAEL